MIKFEYIPWTAERTWGYAEDVPPVESVTMTLGGDVSWEEAVCEFHNFLRASGYVIPYDFEDYSNTGVAPEDESNTDVAEKREWVGLTDDEINKAVQFPYHAFPFARAIEAKLKEKNT